MQKLGVFDSGLGGFNLVSHIRKHLDVDIVFLADHKNLPYGLKNDETLKKILVENITWFKKRKIQHVLIACNTASNYIDYLRSEFPDMNIDSVIEITSRQFDKEELVIFGTNVTAKAKKYDETLQMKHDYYPLSDLATLVEENDAYATENYLKRELKQFKNTSHNYLLACTHYSIVKELFHKYLDGRIYDSVEPTLEFYKDLKGKRQLEVYTTGNIKVLSDQLHDIFREDVSVLPHNQNYKIVLVSDNHGLYQPLVDVIERHKDANVFIHCGDVELNDPILDKFYVVNGNNDYRRPFVDNILLTLYDLKIYITHGDEYPRFSRYNDLFNYAKSINADFVCYGHEHIFNESYINDMLLINPGSLYYNRDNTNPSYALLHIDGKEVTVERLELGE